jgi:hypothetical protein
MGLTTAEPRLCFHACNVTWLGCTVLSGSRLTASGNDFERIVIFRGGGISAPFEDIRFQHVVFLALARTLKTSVVAEGIETPAQAYELNQLGCSHAQRFLFSRALSAQAVETLLVTNVPVGRRPSARCGADCGRQTPEYGTRDEHRYLER